MHVAVHRNGSHEAHLAFHRQIEQEIFGGSSAKSSLSRAGTHVRAGRVDRTRAESAQEPTSSCQSRQVRVRRRAQNVLFYGELKRMLMALWLQFARFIDIPTSTATDLLLRLLSKRQTDGAESSTMVSTTLEEFT